MTIKEIIKSFEGKNKKQIIEIIKRYKKMRKEEYLPYTFINGRPAVRGDLPKLWALAKARKIDLRMNMKYRIIDYKYKFI